MANKWGNNKNSERLYFHGVPNHCKLVTPGMKLNDAYSLKEKLWQPGQFIKKQIHYLANKGPSSQSYDFSSSQLWMCKLDYKKSWAPKNWCFWTVVLERNLESPLNCKEIKLINTKGNQSCIFIGRTDAEAETPILWSLDAKNWSLEKRLMLGKIEGRRRRRQKIIWLDGSPTLWTWVWARSGGWWWTGKPHVLQPMESWRVGLHWLTELNWTEHCSKDLPYNIVPIVSNAVCHR